MSENFPFLDVVLTICDQVLFLGYLGLFSALIYIFFSKRFAILSFVGLVILCGSAVLKVLDISFPMFFKLTKPMYFSFSFIGICVVVFSIFYGISQYQSVRNKGITTSNYRVTYVIIPLCIYIVIILIGAMNLGLDFTFTSDNEMVNGFWELFKGIFQICVWAISVIGLSICMISIILKHIYKRKEKIDIEQDDENENGLLSEADTEKDLNLNIEKVKNFVDGDDDDINIKRSTSHDSNLFDWDGNKENSMSNVSSKMNYQIINGNDGTPMEKSFSTTSAIVEEVGNLSMLALFLILIILIGCTLELISLCIFLYQIYLNGVEVFSSDQEFLFRTSRIFNIITSLLYHSTLITLFFCVNDYRKKNKGNKIKGRQLSSVSSFQYLED